MHSGSPFFTKGRTRADFQSMGKVAELIEARKITTMYLANISAYRRRNALGMLSGPGVDLTFNRSSKFRTPSNEMRLGSESEASMLIETGRVEVGKTLKIVVEIFRDRLGIVNYSAVKLDSVYRAFTVLIKIPEFFRVLFNKVL